MERSIFSEVSSRVIQSKATLTVGLAFLISALAGQQDAAPTVVDMGEFVTLNRTTMFRVGGGTVIASGEFFVPSKLCPD